MSKKTALMSWSSGKDSAWALHTALKNPELDIQGLFCTVNKKFERVAMHAVRIQLLTLQAERLNLPLKIIELPNPCSEEIYEDIMRQFVSKVQTQHIDQFIFGDLYLEHIREYRIQKLSGTGIKANFPIWLAPTTELAHTIIDAGTRAIITCVDPKQLSPDFVGREYDHAFIESLPAGVDPCGENGEFHSFVYDGPMFSSAIDVRVGEIVEREGFTFADVVLNTSTDAAETANNTH